MILKDWVHAIIIPEEHKTLFESHIPDDLESRIYYIENDCKDIWEWSEKVYEFVKGLSEEKPAVKEHAQ